MRKHMKPVIQQEKTGCAIASAAAIAGVTYNQAKKVANRLGIFSHDTNLWSQTTHIRAILNNFGISTSAKEQPFKDWQALPNCALLSIKWRLIHGKPYWHWVVFIRKGNQAYVLDSKKSLKHNVRTDFGRIKPKWFIHVHA